MTAVPSPNRDPHTCPRCPNGHRPPTSHAWSAWVDPPTDGLPPMTITVAPSRGGHVTETDAQWVRDTLRTARTRKRRDTITGWLAIATVSVVGVLAVTILAAIWVGITNAMVP